MKSILSALALAASCLLPSQTMAGGYFGANVGWGNLDDDCKGTTRCDYNGTAFKGAAGYNFSPIFGAEVGYIAFGKSTATYMSGRDSADITMTNNYSYLAGVARLTLNQSWTVFTRLGIGAMKTNANVSLLTGAGKATSVAMDESSTQAIAGLGADYSLAPNVKLNLSADFSRTKFGNGQSNVRALTVGIRYDL